MSATKLRSARFCAFVLLLVGLASWLAWPTFVVAEEGSAEQTLTITGRLVDAQGLGVREAHITVLDEENGHEIGESESHADGSFAVRLEPFKGNQLAIRIIRPHFHHIEWVPSTADILQLRSNGSLNIPDLELERKITPGFFIAALTFAGVLALIALEKLHNTLAALTGITVIFLVSYVATPFNELFFILDFESALQYIDFDVIFLVMGMMIVIGILEETGIFQWLAYWAYRISRGRVWLLSIVLMLLTAIASALLDNVTTMLLMTPISLQIALAMGLNPLALLIPEVLASNVGGIATLIGTPTNILIGSYAGLSFNNFVANLTPGVLMAQAALIIYVQVVFRKDYQAVGNKLSPALSAKLAENARITRPGELRKSGIVFGGMLFLFVIGESLNLVPAVTALMGSTLLLVWIRPDVDEIIRAVDWTTLLFFIGLFVVVGAVQEVGLISMIAVVVGDVVGDNLVLAMVLIAYVSAFFSMVVDNIPFAAAMLPVVGFLTNSIPAAANNALFYTLSVGAAMGGNGSLIGASPNLVTAGIAERAGYPITYSTFIKYGLPSMVLTVSVGLIWLLFRFTI
jgi:Na+/H+ antiporter NhaD/arsenite permease-like protein